MSVPDLIIDPSLRYWVLLPISFAMVLFGVLRQYISILLQPTPKLQPVKKLREIEYIKKAQLLKQHFWNVPKKDFKSRQTYLSENLENGSYLAEPVQENQQPPNPLTDPGASDAMLGMAKNSFGNFAAQTLMMGWVNFFFAGFVLMKLPFPLTLRFKQMLQSGVATADFGWDGSVANQMMQQQVAPSMPGGPTPDKIMNAEANDLKIIPYKHVLEDVDARVLKIYGSK
ncbi:unnamed protein product [Wickerhamomyces anomalus]